MNNQIKLQAQGLVGRRHANFTFHGRQRAKQHCQIAPEQIVRLLDNGKFVTLGEEPGFNRSHQLFYSAVDGTAFIAIQDTLTGAIVSVWPLTYPDSLPWQISAKDLATARNLATGRLEPSTLECRVHFCTNGVQRTRTVMKLRGKLDEIRNLTNETSFKEEVVRAAERQGISGSDLFAFSLGRRATPGERREINRTAN
ncbi:MAG: hypothetical protein R3F04_12065 [Lysobacteraceae bacterium]